MDRLQLFRVSLQRQLEKGDRFMRQNGQNIPFLSNSNNLQDRGIAFHGRSIIDLNKKGR